MNKIDFESFISTSNDIFQLNICNLMSLLRHKINIINRIKIEK